MSRQQTIHVHGVEARQVPGLPGIYASHDGRIWTDHPKNWKGLPVSPRRIVGTKDKNGYVVIAFKTGKRKQKKRFAHQLVLETFVGPRPHRYGTRHLDGNPANNDVTNIKWSTQKTNLGDKVVHGTHNRGSAHSNAKLTEQQVRHMRVLWKRGWSQTTIATQFLVSRQSVQRIVTGKRWRHA